MNHFNSPILKKVFLSLFMTALFCSYITTTQAQSLDSKGTDFWLTFPGNYQGTVTLSFFISGDQNTTGTVSVPGTGFSAPFTVTAGTVTTFTLPADVQINLSNTITNNGIHVTAAKEVTIYGLSRQQFTTDAYLALPTDVLGTSYIALGYKNSNVVNGTQFALVASAANTHVTITPTLTTDGHNAGVPYTITLNQGQTYQLRNTGAAPNDLSGSFITSDKPIAVFGGHQCANIPPGQVACDYVVEQLPPTTAWGKNFISVPLKTRKNGDTFRFLASTNNTTVRVNGTLIATLDRGEFFETIIQGSSQIISSNPILVAQYSNGTSFDNVTSDPFMMLVPPFEQYLGNYTISTPATGFRFNFVNVVAPTSAIGALRLDGAVIPAAAFTPIGATGFSGAQLDVTLGAHTVNGTTLPFGLFVYGFDEADSYGYPGGQSFSPIATATTISITPTSGTSQVGQEACFTATVKDQNGKAVVGIRVDFNITGPNSSLSGFVNTDANGMAKFCYTSTNTGTDKIQAAVGSLTANAQWIWTPATASDVYYSKPAGDLHNVLTWGVNPDGSGANPPDFGAGKTFNLANRGAVYTMTGDWTVGGIVNIPSGAELRINGKTFSEAGLTGAGVLTGSLTSNLIITGIAGGDAGSLKFSTGAGGSLNNFTLNRSGTGAAATLGSALNIYGVLTITNGNFKTSNLLTLKSNAANTARVAPLLGSITGNVTVERFIPARRAWRIVNAPIGGTQTINAAWQEGATTASPNPNPHPGFGTHITIGSVANGFDQNPGANSSIKWYNSSTDAWANLANTNATAVGNKAYMLFVRGDRGIHIGPRTVPPTNTVLRATGPLLTGNRTYPVSASGFTAIPNPFASPINFATITRNNVQNNFYLWDPKMGGANGVGAFVNVSFNGSVYEVTPASVSPESQYIQSGQGFLVHSTGVAGSVVIKESDKSATPAMNVFSARPGGSVNEQGNQPVIPPGLRVNLQVANAQENISVLDEVYTSYNNSFSLGIDNIDAVKAENMNENLAIVREGHSLMVDRRPMSSDIDTIQLRLWNTTPTSYVLEFNPVNLGAANRYAFLEDKYLHTWTSVSTSDLSQVYFTVNADAASADPGRFMVILSTQNRKPVVTDATALRVLAYPNPMIGNNINLQFENAAKGPYRMEIVNTLGQVVFRKDIQHTGGSAVQTVNVSTRLSKGIYQLHLTGRETKTSVKIIKE